MNAPLKKRFNLCIDASGTGEQKIAVGQRGKTDGSIIATYSQAANIGQALPCKFYTLQVNRSQKELQEFIRREKGFSLRRLLADVNKNVKIIRPLIAGLFDEAEGNEQPGLSLWNILDRKPRGIQITVNARNAELAKLGNVVQDILKDYLVVVLSGLGSDQDDSTTNAMAEALIKMKIREAKVDGKEGVIILSANIAQRSFSISEIDAVILMYDGGTISTTAQRSSRGATEGLLWDGTMKTDAIIITLSTEDVQEDKGYELILHDALVQAKQCGTKLFDEVKVVYQNFNMYRIVEGSPIALEISEIIDELSEHEIIERITEADIDLDALFNDEHMSSLLAGCDAAVVKGSKENKKELMDKIKTFKTLSSKPTGEGNPEAEPSSEREERERLFRIVQALLQIRRTAPSIAIMANETSLYAALNKILQSESLAEEFYCIYSIEIAVAAEILMSEFVDTERSDIMINREYERLEQEHENLWK